MMDKDEYDIDTPSWWIVMVIGLALILFSPIEMYKAMKKTKEGK